MTNLALRIAVLAVLTALALPMSAIAASSEEAYGGPNNVVSGVQGGETGSSDNGGAQPIANVASVGSSADDSGLLPFTGADLAILASAGLIMLGLGYGLRRVTRHPPQL